jgi:hypothetical protein
MAMPTAATPITISMKIQASKLPMGSNPKAGMAVVSNAWKLQLRCPSARSSAHERPADVRGHFEVEVIPVRPVEVRREEYVEEARLVRLAGDLA